MTPLSDAAGFEVGRRFHPDCWGQGCRMGMSGLGRTQSVELRTDLAVRRHGRPPNEAPTLVFLHGLTDSGAGWPGAIAHWRDQYSIITIDQRGHGESPRFTAEQLDGHPGDVLVDDAVALLEQLGSAPVLIGHSLGGAVALATAVRRPDLVRALVLEDPAGLDEDEDQRSADKGRELLDSVAASVATQGDEALTEARRKQHPEWPEDELLVTGRAEQQVDRDFLAVGDYKPSTRWPELISELTVPALVLTGDAEDVVVGERLTETMRNAGNANLTVECLPGAGHCVRRTQPDRYYQLVDAFLTSH
jgi:pimeloyl-ACP methyl ester carboxylesterase